MKREEANLFAPTGAWRKRRALSRYVVAVTNAAGCVEGCFNRKEFTKDNFDFSVRELRRAADALAKFYFDRNTKSSKKAAKDRRVWFSYIEELDGVE